MGGEVRKEVCKVRVKPVQTLICISIAHRKQIEIALLPSETLEMLLTFIIYSPLLSPFEPKRLRYHLLSSFAGDTGTHRRVAVTNFDKRTQSESVRVCDWVVWLSRVCLFTLDHLLRRSGR